MTLEAPQPQIAVHSPRSEFERLLEMQLKRLCHPMSVSPNPDLPFLEPLLCPAPLFKRGSFLLQASSGSSVAHSEAVSSYKSSKRDSELLNLLTITSGL
jgi:hypothetical protein